MNTIDLFPDRILITADEIVIPSHHYLKHDGYTHRVSFLLTALHKISEQIPSRRLRFVFSDGEPVIFSGFLLVINHIQKTYNISRERTIIELIDPITDCNLDSVTVVTVPSPFFSRDQQVNRLLTQDLVMDADAKIFGACYGRLTVHRMMMCYFLETQHADKSFTVFHPGADFVEFETDPVKNLFAEEISWARRRVETNRTTTESNHNGWIWYLTSLESYPEIWKKYQIEIIGETNTLDLGWFTDKTTRCLASGKPFIRFGTAHALKRLQDMGFKTYGPWINESYDQCTNIDQRFDLIKQEIDRIAKLDQLQLQELISNIQHIAQWNKDNYLRLSKIYYESFNDNRRQQTN